MQKKILFYLFIGFLLTRWLYSGNLLTIYTIITFTIPFIYFFRKKDYHLFAFDVKDTLQSIGINLVFSIGFIVFMLLIGLIFSNFSWISLFGLSINSVLILFAISFFQEMLFRYFLENIFVNEFGKIIGIIITSIISSIVVFPPITMSLVYLIMGLFIGWVFEQTKDIYGATFAHFLIYLFAFIMV